MKQDQEDPQRPVAAPVGLEIVPAPLLIGDNQPFGRPSTGAFGGSGDRSAVSAGAFHASTGPRLQSRCADRPRCRQVGNQPHQAHQREDVERAEHHRVVALDDASKPSRPSPSSEKIVSISSEPEEERRDEGAGEAGDDDQHRVAEHMAIQHLRSVSPLARAVITYCLRISSRNEFLVSSVRWRRPHRQAISGSARCQK
jgi:hypothetical protein